MGEAWKLEGGNSQAVIPGRPSVEFTHIPDRLTEILPALRDISLTLAKATGLSISYCPLIRCAKSSHIRATGNLYWR